ncbi:hypothetical protein CPB85DRAFT_1312015 [Mucidula mucida]|nr:hypothetical protein CPB85DRAFT_1312015 [Mucidula mucida]
MVFVAIVVIVGLLLKILGNVFTDQGGSYDSKINTSMFGDIASRLPACSVLRSLRVALARSWKTPLDSGVLADLRAPENAIFGGEKSRIGGLTSVGGFGGFHK